MLNDRFIFTYSSVADEQDHYYYFVYIFDADGSFVKMDAIRNIYGEKIVLRHDENLAHPA